MDRRRPWCSPLRARGTRMMMTSGVPPVRRTLCSRCSPSRTRLQCVLNPYPRLSGHRDGVNLLVAAGTIHRTVVLRKERNARVGPAAGADYGVHFSMCSARAVASASGAAIGTAPWLIHEAFLEIEPLLTRGKDKTLLALAASHGLVCESHVSPPYFGGNSACDFRHTAIVRGV